MTVPVVPSSPRNWSSATEVQNRSGQPATLRCELRSEFGGEAVRGARAVPNASFSDCSPEVSFRVIDRVEVSIDRVTWSSPGG